MSPVFFTDRDLGDYVFPQRLRDAGITVERHVDHFRPAAPDVEWLRVVATRHWYVLTKDRKILTRPHQRSTVVEHGLGVFILVGGNLSADVRAQNFINTHAKIQRFIEEHKRPFIANVYRPSPVSMIGLGRPGSVKLKYPR